MNVENGDEFKISVIIPTFNRAHTLGSSIESILNQTSDKWELIIIDDGSTDGTPNLMNQYLVDQRIKYYYQQHQGVSTARNFGVLNAQGDYIIFLDSDDTFTPNLIDQLYSCQIFKYDVIFWEVMRVTEKVTKIGKPVKLGNIYNKLTANFLAGCVCYNKDVFLKAGGFDPKITFGENYELGIRISWLSNLKIKIIDYPFLIYNIKTHGRTSNSIENRLNSYVYQLKKHDLLYSQNIRARAEMHYLMGFVLEKNKSYSEAIISYKKSWLAYPLNIKPLLKILYLQTLI